MVRIRILSTLLLITTLSSCGQLSSLIPLGGGTNVAANTQVGKENNQTFGVSNTLRPVLRPEGPVDSVVQDNSTTKNTEIDPFMLLLLILGWLAPSPNEIGRGVVRIFKRK